jgi:GNAT superfamily N-acetyltransferase
MEIPTMPIMLAHLVARLPTFEDFDMIAKLVAACDMAEDGAAERSRPDQGSLWQLSSFHPERDAWVIVNPRKQFVGFACVWHRDHEEFSAFLCVHPNYRKRGIGTLLLRLAEQRARELMRLACPGLRVSLRCRMNAKHAPARSLFEREGYLAMREFWRVTLELVEASGDDVSHAGKFAVELDVEAGHLVGSTALYDREGIYTVRQFVTYEKELRLAEETYNYDADSAETLTGSKQVARTPAYGAGNPPAPGEREPVAAGRHAPSTTQLGANHRDQYIDQ